MRIEIITTGDELMSGLTQDSNFSWSGDVLTSRGFTVEFHTTVGDERVDISSALGIASERADAVIVSGALGHPDDLDHEARDILRRTARARTCAVSLIEKG
jgi:molybdopterin-biosynthesis enzyme MoeA-like protein